jgi:hypothetical protein
MTALQRQRLVEEVEADGALQVGILGTRHANAFALLNCRLNSNHQRFPLNLLAKLSTRGSVVRTKYGTGPTRLPLLSFVMDFLLTKFTI